MKCCRKGRSTTVTVASRVAESSCAATQLVKCNEHLYSLCLKQWSFKAKPAIGLSLSSPYPGSMKREGKHQVPPVTLYASVLSISSSINDRPQHPSFSCTRVWLDTAICFWCRGSPRSWEGNKRSLASSVLEESQEAQPPPRFAAGKLKQEGWQGTEQSRYNQEREQREQGIAQEDKSHHGKSEVPQDALFCYGFQMAAVRTPAAYSLLPSRGLELPQSTESQ